MDASQSVSLKECLLELLDPNTSPEKALQSFSTTCFSPEDYPRGAKEPIVIFRAYMRFIVTRLPGACVDGIWENIFRKTVMYSHDCSGSEIEIMAQARRLFPTAVAANGIKECMWLNKALAFQINCPNPYTRLEMFRLIRIFKNSWKDIYWSCINVTFINTISDIQPQSLYSNGDVDKTLFDFHDFHYIIYKCYEHGKMVSTISESYRDVSVEFISNKPRFLSHCFQLIGIFARSTSLLSDSKTQLARIKSLCSLFYKMTFTLKTSWRQFQHLISCPCVVETICDITAAIINNKEKYKKKAAIVNIRDYIVRELDIKTKPSDLPKLLVSRQIQDSAFRVHQCTLLYGNLPHRIHVSMNIRQHTLLIRKLRHLYKNNHAANTDDISDFNSDYETTDDEIEEEGNEEEVDEAIYEETDIEESEVDESYIEDSDANDF